MGLAIKDLPVANYMTPYPISVTSDFSFEDAVDLMARKGIGNLIINDDTIPHGILTEREILKCIVTKEGSKNKQVKDLGYQPFLKVDPNTLILDAAKIMISKKSRLLVFEDPDKLVGIITVSDMIRAFRKTDESPSIEKVQTSMIHQCSSNNTILEAAKIMDEKRIGSVILDDIPQYGIFTERDLLVHVLANEVDLNNEVGGYSSEPLIVAKQGILANEAASIMASHNIKRLGLIEAEKLVGIVTARDLVDAFQSGFQASLNPYLE